LSFAQNFLFGFCHPHKAIADIDIDSNFTTICFVGLWTTGGVFIRWKIGKTDDERAIWKSDIGERFCSHSDMKLNKYERRGKMLRTMKAMGHDS
jgi:hypothetical protein